MESAGMKHLKTYSRREFVGVTAGLAATTVGAVACGVSKQPSMVERKGPPNVLYVFADQMRFSALGCMGNGLIRTPNLDVLAGQGILFSNAFSSSPVCSPYRSQLMTGKYSHKTGVVRNGLKLSEDETCIAEIFKEAGYSTGYIGKWHLGGIPATGFLPPGKARQGWDYWAAMENLRDYFRPRYYLDTPEMIEREGFQPNIYTDLAIEYIKRNKERPFCLMLSWVPPHNLPDPVHPYVSPKQFDIYKPEDIPLRPNVPPQYEVAVRTYLAGYYGLITSLDYNIGRLMQTLDEAGIAENTIFCFTSDHGDMVGSQGQIQKQRPWEESIHVPFIMRYPREIEPRQNKDAILSSVDIMPTLLGLCNLQAPRDVQGQDLSPIVLSKTDKGPESAYFAIQSHGAGPGWDWRGVRTKEWKYAVAPVGDWVLYNIAEDPYELNNLADDSRYMSEKKQLKSLVKEWIDATGDNFPIPGD